MLKKQFRLDPHTSFKHAKFFTSSFFNLRVIPNNLYYNRYGFLVSKKIDKRAVVRNRIRRQIRSCIEGLFHSIKNGHDMLFLVKKDIVARETKDICSSISTLLQKEDFLL